MESGYVETIPMPKHFKNGIHHVSQFFFDLPLKTELKRQECIKIQLDGSRLYCDHNFGFEPLYKIKNNWSWWHCESSSYWEVVYFFPKLNKSFFISKNLIGGQIVNHFNNDGLVLQKRNHSFLFSTPSQINSVALGRLNFSRVIECAPFYARSKIDNHTNSITGTLEHLIPKRIPKTINQFLMKARKLCVDKMIDKKEELELTICPKNLLEKIARYNGKSFYFSSFVLNKDDRTYSYFIYTLCRLIDDSTDIALENNGLEYQKFGASFSEVFINVLWNNDSSLLNDLFLDNLKLRLESSIQHYLTRETVLNFLSLSKNLVKTLALDKSYFEELIKGQKMDEDFCQPLSFEDFYLYCYRVAGVVGLMMAHLFGVKDNAIALKAAEHLGIAMQITNILRDVKEDSERGRIYIPRYLSTETSFYELLKNNNTSQNNNSAKFINELSLNAIYYYQSSLVGLTFIPKVRHRFCVRLMVAMYSAILSEVIKNEFLIFKRRVFVSSWKKVFIFFKILCCLDPLKTSGLNLRKLLIHFEVPHEKL